MRIGTWRRNSERNDKSPYRNIENNRNKQGKVWKKFAEKMIEYYREDNKLFCGTQAQLRQKRNILVKCHKR